MRGHIVKRYKNSYLLKISLGKDTDTGKYRYQYCTVQGSRKDAEKKLTEMWHQRDTGIYTKPGKITLAEYLNKWLEDYAKPNLSPRSFERYESISQVHLIPGLGNIPLPQLRADQIQKLYNDKLNGGLSARTVRYHHVILHKALQTAIKWGLLSRNVADGADVPRAQRNEMQTWNESGINTFLEAAKNTQYYTLFYMALYTGMRRSELLALRWQDVDLIYSQLYVNRSMHHLKDGTYVFTQPKTARSRRTIALSPSAALVLNEHKKAKESEHLLLDTKIADHDLVFSALNKPLRPNTVSRAWTNLAAQCGIKVIRFHDARHTHASLMLKQGIHPKILQERLGHASIQMTLDTYSHVAPGLQEAAAESFDKLLNQDAEKQLVTN